MSRPLVSVITPTIPTRHDLLLECIDNVRQQTYRPMEHVVVADGSDSALLELMCSARVRSQPREDRVPLRFQELGRPWSPLLPVESLGVAPLLVGMLLARGDYLAWHCDDERFLDPSALTVLVDRLEETGADFAYPKVRMYRNGTSPERGYDIGTDPPLYGEFTWCVFRATLLQQAMPRFHGPIFNDWDLAQRWIAAGASWSFVDRTLVTHRADR